MASDDDITQKCVDDIVAKIKLVPSVQKQTFVVYSEDDMLDQTKGIHRPCIGVMYEGVHSVPDAPNQGMTCDLTVAIAVVEESKAIGNLDRKKAIIALLKDIRAKIRMSKAPSQHTWRFVAEAPAIPMGNAVIYIQRWVVRVILT